MNSQIKLTLLFLLVVVNAVAQKKALESITENELKEHLEFIASDNMQGRDFGTPVPGLELTADYLKKQCMIMGLKPGSPDYFQIVEMVSVKPDMENTFIILNGINGLEKYKTKDLITLGVGGTTKNDTLTGNIVFCGYGWYNEATKYNDTRGLDLKDKIVLVMTRNLETALDTSKKSINTNREMLKREMMKIDKACLGGAKALILVPDPLNNDKRWSYLLTSYVSSVSCSMKGMSGRPTIPLNLIYGTEELANEILKESGKTLLQLQNEINTSGSPKSFDIKNCKAEIQLIKKVEPVEGKNVIAILEGSDPVLKNECVVLTAHYDHLGVAANGVALNGADDNGSGTVALLEIAEAFTNMEKHPKRSIVFAWVTAEEKGLFGSDYYIQHPVFPLEKTLTNINLDGIGRSAEKEPEKDVNIEKGLCGPNGVYILSEGRSSELLKISDTACKQLNLIPNDGMPIGFLASGDHYHFYKNGIPVLGVTTGFHEDLHLPTDDVDKIDYHKMKRVTEFAFLVTDKVANQDKRIVVDNPINK
jgi:hypothetical protein